MSCICGIGTLRGIVNTIPVRQPERSATPVSNMGYHYGLRRGTVAILPCSMDFRGEALVGKSLYEKVFDRHVVRSMAGGTHQLFIGLHFVHEVTSPHAFQDLRDRGLTVR